MYSELLKLVLDKEKKIRRDLKIEYSSPESMIYALADYFDKPYLGITSMDEDYPISFEEERVRLIFKKVLKSSISLSKRVFLKFLKTSTTSEDYLSCLYDKTEFFLKERKQALLTCDILLLSCLLDLNSDNQKAIKNEFHQFKMESLLKQIDQEIYPYVIEQVTTVQNKLHDKMNKAIFYRDFQPARKFVDEKVLLEYLQNSVEMTLKDQLLTLTIPFFFKDAQEPLILSIIKKGDMYYIHDHGCAIRELNKRIPSKEECILLTKNFIAGTICHLVDDVVVGDLNSFPYFSKYLQRLIMIANLDIVDDIYLIMEDYEREEVYPFIGQDDLSEFMEYIQDYFKTFYDEKEGLLISSHLCYFGNNTTASFLLETNDKNVTIKDYYNRYQEGAIFENIWYNIDDLSPYVSYINTVIHRFNANFNGKEVSLTFEYDTKESFIQAFFNFIQSAVLLAPMNDYFDLDKINRRYH